MARTFATVGEVDLEPNRHGRGLGRGLHAEDAGEIATLGERSGGEQRGAVGREGQGGRLRAVAGDERGGEAGGDGNGFACVIDKRQPHLAVGGDEELGVGF